MTIYENLEVLLKDTLRKHPSFLGAEYLKKYNRQDILQIGLNLYKRCLCISEWLLIEAIAVELLKND